jgi:hypothetical protein
MRAAMRQTWPAPGLNDTELNEPGLLLERIGLRYPIVECLRLAYGSARCSRTHPLWRVAPHQSFDPVQTDSKSRQTRPGPIGPIARQEAGADLRVELFITAAAPTERSCQPSVASATRDTERPAHPVHGPDPPVLRIEENFTSTPSRSRPRFFLGCLVLPSASSARA